MHPELERLERDFSWRLQNVASLDDKSGSWCISTTVIDASVYSDEQWVTMDSLLDESWWYHTRNFIIHETLRIHGIEGPVWDIGGGSGVVAKYLDGHGIPTAVIEPSYGGAALAAKRGVLSVCAAFEKLRLPKSSLHAVSMFDVLEHVEDRESLLREVHRVLVPGGHLVLTLPALQTLWSQFDEDGGHFLRYSKRVIARELNRNGFEVCRTGYFFLLTVLPLFLLRVVPYRLGLRRAVATESTLGASGGLIGRFAARVEQLLAMRAPFGSSLLVIAKKAGD